MPLAPIGVAPSPAGTQPDDLNALMQVINRLVSMGGMVGSLAGITPSAVLSSLGGLLGLSSGAGGIGTALSGLASAGGFGAGAAGAALPAIGSLAELTSAPLAMYAPGAGLAIPIIMNELMSPSRSDEQALDRYLGALQDLPRGIAMRKAGANVEDLYPQLKSPEQRMTALELAAQGLNADQFLSGAYEAATKGTGAGRTFGMAGGGPERGNPAQWQGYTDQAQQLAGKNVTSYFDLLDAAAKEGGKVPIIPEAQDWAYGAQGQQWAPTAQMRAEYGQYGGDPQRSPTQAGKYYQPLGVFDPLDIERNLGALGRQFGVDESKLPTPTGGLGELIARGDPNSPQPTDWAAQGFTPGHYGQAAHDWLLKQDPTLAQNQAFQDWTTRTLPQSPAGLTPEQTTTNEQAFQKQLDDYQAQLAKQRQDWDEQEQERLRSWSMTHGSMP